MSLNYLFEMNEQNCSKTSIYIIGYTDFLWFFDEKNDQTNSIFS